MSPIFVPIELEPEEPPVEPPLAAAVSAVYHHAFTLVGGDGSVWDLVGGPVYILAGASGFGFPDPEHHWQVSPLADGSVHRGLRYPEREFSIPLEVDGKYLEPPEWRDLERRLWEALNPRHDCRLIVTSPAGIVRTITFRYDGGGDPGFDLDAMLRADNVYPLEGIAGDPFWKGETVSRAYGIEQTQPTFPGPPFYLSSSTAIQSTTLTNPGDEDAWWTSTITGPYDSATIGVGDSVVTLETPIDAGQYRIIQTAPTRRSLRDEDGVLVWGEATSLQFAPIPAGAQAPVTMAMAGGIEGQSSISLEFESTYLRAFS